MKVYGPYLREDGRMHVVIIYDDGTKRTQSYPRYLYEKFHNVILNPWEDVHHKDEDINNNSIDNLKVISSTNHALMHSSTKYTKCICPECDTPFEVATYVVTRGLKLGRDGPFCKKSCAGKWNGRKRKY